MQQYCEISKEHPMKTVSSRAVLLMYTHCQQLGVHTLTFVRAIALRCNLIMFLKYLHLKSLDFSWFCSSANQVLEF